MPDDPAKVVGVILDDGALSNLVIEQEDHRTHKVAFPKTPTVEEDADGERIAIKDAAGAIKGYVGWSTAMGGISFWPVETDIVNGSGAMFQLYPDGGWYIQGNEGYIVSSPDGHIKICPGSEGSLGVGNNSLGIDGTDTVPNATDAASVIARLNELLVVLRNLGVLAS
jgi:hypothetical protein